MASEQALREALVIMDCNDPGNAAMIRRRHAEAVTAQPAAGEGE